MKDQFYYTAKNKKREGKNGNLGKGFIKKTKGNARTLL